MIASATMVQTWSVDLSLDHLPMATTWTYAGNGPAWFIASLLPCWLSYPFWKPYVVNLPASVLLIFLFLSPLRFLVTMGWTSSLSGSALIPMKTLHFLHTFPAFCFLDFLAGAAAAELTARRANEGGDQEKDVWSKFFRRVLPWKAGVLADAVALVFVTSLLFLPDIGPPCPSMAEDGCLGGQVSTGLLAPVLIALWMTLSSLDAGSTGLFGKLLEHRAFSTISCSSACLLMILLQDPWIMLLLRGGIVHGGRFQLPLKEFVMATTSLWIISWPIFIDLSRWLRKAETMKFPTKFGSLQKFSQDAAPPLEGNEGFSVTSLILYLLSWLCFVDLTKHVRTFMTWIFTAKSALAPSKEEPVQVHAEEPTKDPVRANEPTKEEHQEPFNPIRLKCKGDRFVLCPADAACATRAISTNFRQTGASNG